MRRLLFALAIIPIILAISLSPKDKYALEVDAIRDPSDLASFYRIVLVNKGSEELTNITIDFGSYKQSIPKLMPNEKIVISPKQEVTRDYVIITSDEGIFIEKRFRIPTSLPGHH